MPKHIQKPNLNQHS